MRPRQPGVGIGYLFVGRIPKGFFSPATRHHHGITCIGNTLQATPVRNNLWIHFVQHDLRSRRWNSNLNDEGSKAGSKLETHTHRRAGELDVLDEPGTALVINKMMIGCQYIAPLEAISHTSDSLPGEIRITCTDVEVIGDVPILVEVIRSFDANDGIPEID